MDSDLKTIQEGWEIFRQAVPAERYRLTWSGRYTFTEGKERGSKEVSPGTPAADVSGKLSKLLGLNRENFNIYVTPLSEKYFYLLGDDLTLDNLSDVFAAGYMPSWVCETSPGNFQLTLTLEKSSADDVSLELAKRAADNVMRSFNQLYGDPNISGSSHGQRLPGFGNVKLLPDGRHKYLVPSPSGAIVWRVRRTRSGLMLCQKTAALFAAEVARLRAEVAPAPRRPVTRTSRPSGTPTPAVTYVACPNAVISAEWHYMDTLDKSGQSRLEANWSKIDWMVGCRLRVMGFAAGEVAHAIAERSVKERPAGKNNHYDFSDYVSRTVSRIFALGDDDRTLSKLRKYSRRWPLV